jgi:hypothetical protein
MRRTVSLPFEATIEVEPIGATDAFHGVDRKDWPHLQELQDALVADEERFDAWCRLAAWEAVAHLTAKDLHECQTAGLDSRRLEIVKPLVAGLSEGARSYFERALMHWYWFSQHDDGAAFVLSFRAQARGFEEPWLEPTEADDEMLDIYLYGELPEPGGAPKKKAKAKPRSKGKR